MSHTIDFAYERRQAATGGSDGDQHREAEIHYCARRHGGASSGL